MGRLAWSQLRFRTVRLIALLVGMLVATTAFTVLTAASRTAQLRTVGTVSAHFVPAYDILVRPRGARTSLEDQTGSVQPNFLSGIYGGITMAQYRQIQQVPGVQVAAPVAMVGYALLVSNLVFTVPPASYARPGRQLYRITTTWISQAGTNRIAQPASYLYVTPSPARYINSNADFAEVLPHGRSVVTCTAHLVSAAANPFGVAAQSTDGCWSKVNGEGPGSGYDRPSDPTYLVGWVVPVLIAAIDPAAEARLDGLDRAVISGKYLSENASDGTAPPDTVTFPVLASSSSGMDEYALTSLQELAPPKAPPVQNVRWMTSEASAPGETIRTSRTTAAQAYRSLLTILAGRNGLDAVFGYWSAGPVSYRRAPDGALVPVQVSNPASVWFSGGGAVPTSMDNEASQYRRVTGHVPPSGGAGGIASPQLVGIFNQARVRSFDPLSQVPLGLYQPVQVAPASAATDKALHGSDLLPNQNLGGYVTQPVNLITSLSALPALQNNSYYSGNLHEADPISVIRVRVAGVTGPNALSLERIREVAEQIAVRTHLDVDIVAGSSPAPTIIDLPAGKFGQPALSLSEGWVKKGVAIAILTAIDKDSVVLFTLILIVCVLFVANSASVAIRGRRRELAVLACLGWTRPRLFAAVLGELAALGLASGVLGAAAALPLSSALGLHASPGRAALALPIAVAVATLAGLFPAWIAARAEPTSSVRPPVLGVRRARQPDGVTALALVNVLRMPGRAVVGAVSLAVGIAALTVLSAVSLAFRGVAVGSLLGNAVAVQVRTVDYVAAGATVALGVLAVADVVFLNVRERAPELATIRSLGWPESALSRLVITEGAIIGLAGSCAGAVFGLVAAAEFAGQLPVALDLIAVAAVAAGLAVTTIAALVPAMALRRLPAAQLLAEE